MSAEDLGFSSGTGALRRRAAMESVVNLGADGVCGIQAATVAAGLAFRFIVCLRIDCGRAGVQPRGTGAVLISRAASVVIQLTHSGRSPRRRFFSALKASAMSNAHSTSA